MKTHIYVQAFALVLLFTGCSASDRHKVLNIFFDGVPDPPAITHEDLKGQIEAHLEEEKAKNDGKPKTSKFPQEKSSSVHPPYAERMCDSCHESKFSQKLVEDEVKDLCFSCHDDFLSDAEIPHFPAAEGMCLDCHNPHLSKNESLLTIAGQRLCFQCHDEEEILKSEVHEGLGDEKCWSCHNPHGE